MEKQEKVERIGKGIIGTIKSANHKGCVISMNEVKSNLIPSPFLGLCITHIFLYPESRQHSHLKHLSLRHPPLAKEQLC